MDIVFDDEPSVTYTGYYIDWVDLDDGVFGEEPAAESSGIAAFATCATDAIRVLTYIHDRALPAIDVE